jgi:hypothetical protein
MRLLRKSLLLASAMAALRTLHFVVYGVLRELGTGAPGPLKASHFRAQLISDGEPERTKEQPATRKERGSYR